MVLMAPDRARARKRLVQRRNSLLQTGDAHLLPVGHDQRDVVITKERWLVLIWAAAVLCGGGFKRLELP